MDEQRLNNFIAALQGIKSLDPGYAPGNRESTNVTNQTPYNNIIGQAGALNKNILGGFETPNTGHPLNDFITSVLRYAPMAMGARAAHPIMRDNLMARNLERADAGGVKAIQDPGVVNSDRTGIKNFGEGTSKLDFPANKNYIPGNTITNMLQERMPPEEIRAILSSPHDKYNLEILNQLLKTEFKPKSINNPNPLIKDYKYGSEPQFGVNHIDPLEYKLN